MYKQVSRPNKKAIRRLFFSQVNNSKNFLCFPSTRCLDVKDALELGSINKDTKVLAVERDKKKLLSIHRTMKSLGLKYQVINDEATRIFLNDFIEFAYIDFCGQVSEELLVWISSINFSENAKVAITFTETERSHDTFYRRLLIGKYDNITTAPKYTRGIHEKNEKIDKVCSILSTFLPGIKFNITQVYHDTTARMMFLGGFFGNAGQIKKRANSKTVNTEGSFEKAKARLEEFQKGIKRHQQIGGFKIIWKNLTRQQKAALRRMYEFSDIV